MRVLKSTSNTAARLRWSFVRLYETQASKTI